MNTSTRQTQRAELHKTIWRAACDLVHGSGVGTIDFRDYFLGMLFYRFISENLAAYINRHERQHNPDFDYTRISDAQAENARATLIQDKGFYIRPSQLFANVHAVAQGDQNLNQTLAQILKNIEGSAIGSESEERLKGLFDDLDFNSKKLGSTVGRCNEKIIQLMNAIASLPLGARAGDNYAENAIDLFGDAYEYLLHMYAAGSGKSGGEFFTPQEVSQLLARIALGGKTSINKVYDPACGSGSLLLQFSKILPQNHIRHGFYGQEITLTTYNLCRMNMFLHNIGYEKIHIAHGNTLIDPKHWDDEPFEAIVSNPPYSTKWEGRKNPSLIHDPRFAPAGVLAPDSKADLAFVMHMLAWLSVNGTAAIVEFPGVLYRGGAEQKIRHYLVDGNYIDSIIQLPADLFFGVTIATCIIVLKKSKADNHILFIDASAEYERRGNKNILTESNRQKILQALAERQNIPHFSQLVGNQEIVQNQCNLSVSTWVEAKDTREKIDITQLNAEIARIVARQAVLRGEIDAIVMELEAV